MTEETGSGGEPGARAAAETDDRPDGLARQANRLIGEKSPYLLQHATNPVDWHPWGEEAFARARAQEKPIFLSIGYSTCHWCHVMERESFEDPEVAELLNDAFVCIKVDREERPDIDGLYMTVCQMMTGGGGWPLTVVLTPEKEPFFAGTYFPKRSRGGRIGMMDLVPRLRRAWEEQRGDLERTGGKVLEALRRAGEQASGAEAGELMDDEPLHGAHRALRSSYDELQGGFGRAPKFPTPHILTFLLRYGRRTGREEAVEMVDETLKAMRRGGIWDHVGFGFHRYSTDARWLLPHFEKMLYDQALLTVACSEAYLATGDPGHERTVRGIVEYVLRDLRDPLGGFHSAEDADSEGREGAFYLWTDEELKEVLPREDALLARRVWNVTDRGNFAEEATGRRTGENILHRRKPISQLAADEGLTEAELRERLAGIRRRLFRAREKRERPFRDDKVLTDWNGLMVAGLAIAARALGEPSWSAAAREAVEFLLGNLRDREGRLLHRWREGEAAIRATADDYAFLVWGLVELYETDYRPRWLREALRLQEEFLAHFWDDEGPGGFFETADDAEVLPARRKADYDGATPAANSVAYRNLLRLARLTGRTELEERAEELERAMAPRVREAPAGHTHFLGGLDFRLGPVREVVIVGRREADDTRRMLDALRGAFLPRTVSLLKPGDGPDGEAALDELAPFTRDHRTVDGRAAAYVCRDFACRAPTVDPEELRRELSVEGA